MPRDSSRFPPRSDVLQRRSMLLSFDVDCGELISGHHLVARGLAGPYQDDNGYPTFGFEYELVPGVGPGNDDRFFHYLVGISYSAGVELPWEPQDGGVIAPFDGAPTTHGSRGDWPLPPGARVLTFTLFAVTEEGFQSEEPAGTLVVDLPRGAARWHPA